MKVCRVNDIKSGLNRWISQKSIHRWPIIFVVLFRWQTTAKLFV